MSFADGQRWMDVTLICAFMSRRQIEKNQRTCEE